MGLTRGLTKIELSDIATDGGVGTTFATLGFTDADSTASFTQADATETLFMAAESDQPVDKDVTPGAITLAYSLLDPDPDKMVILFGGTVTGSGSAKVWSAPLQSVTIEKSVKITPKKGMVITVVRGQLSAKINFDLQKTSKMVVDISIAVLVPTKSATAPFTLGPTV